VVSALLLVFGIGGLVGNSGVVRLLSRRLKATVVGMASTPAVATALMPLAGGSLLGGGVVGILGDRGAIWTGTVFAVLALLGLSLFGRPVPAGRGQAGAEPAGVPRPEDAESLRKGS
jgi:predicted MFS family arabinose efflux permease